MLQLDARLSQSAGPVNSSSNSVSDTLTLTRDLSKPPPGARGGQGSSLRVSGVPARRPNLISRVSRYVLGVALRSVPFRSVEVKLLVALGTFRLVGASSLLGWCKAFTLSTLL